MRAIVAKRLRRLVYGKGHHPGPVLYRRKRNGQVVSDQVRGQYQAVKWSHVR